MVDDDIVEAEMDEYFHQQPDEYIEDYSYVDPKTGLTPKQQAWEEYQQAWEDYEANWIGTPYMDRTEDPPQWEDFWQEPVAYQRPNRQYQYHQQSNYSPEKERTKGEKIAIIVAASLFFVAIIELIISIFI